MNLAYFFGVVLVGAAVGAMAVTLLWSRASGDPHVLIVVAFAVVGALAAMWLQRYVVVTGTAFGGAWTLLVGVLALMGDAAAQAATAANGVWVVYPLDPAPGRRWLPVAWLALGAVGVFVQLRKAGPRIKKVSRTRVLMTYVNHRDTENTKTAQRHLWGATPPSRRQSQRPVSVRLRVLCVSVVDVRHHRAPRSTSTVN